MYGIAYRIWSSRQPKLEALCLATEQASLWFKQAGYNWFAKLSNGLKDRGFVPSSVDPCVFFDQGCIVLTYVDTCIIVGDLMHQIDALIQLLHKGDNHFVLQDEGLIDKYLGVNIKQIDAHRYVASLGWALCYINNPTLGLKN